MRDFRIAAGATLLLAAILISYAYVQVGVKAPANSSISGTLAYLNRVNDSGYLIFSPNLTAAYSDLSEASNLSRINPAASAQLVQSARQIAQRQEAILDSRRGGYITATAVATVVLAALLYYVTMPARRRPKA